MEQITITVTYDVSKLKDDEYIQSLIDNSGQEIKTALTRALHNSSRSINELIDQPVELIRNLLRYISVTTLVNALYDGNSATKEYLFCIMGERSANIVRDRLASLNPSLEEKMEALVRIFSIVDDFHLGINFPSELQL
jgi:flagellar motor switch protein FliG